MRVVVVGADGLLGSNVVAQADAIGHDVIGTYHETVPGLDVTLTHLDIRERAAFTSLLERREPDVVVNCAAMTDVDACEDDPTRASAINTSAPGEMAAICQKFAVDFVHVSTDYVFDGTATEPYSEDAPTRPLQVYGQTKREGEIRVLDAYDDALVPRLSFVYGVHRGTDRLGGFPGWLIDRLDSGERAPLFDDQFVTPSRAGATAEALLELTARGSSGIYHVAARSCVTPFQFGQEICDVLGRDSSQLVESRLSEIERPARRPQYTCLDVSKLETDLGRRQPTLSTDLAVIADLSPPGT